MAYYSQIFLTKTKYGKDKSSTANKWYNPKTNHERADKKDKKKEEPVNEKELESAEVEATPEKETEPVAHEVIETVVETTEPVAEVQEVAESEPQETAVSKPVEAEAEPQKEVEEVDKELLEEAIRLHDAGAIENNRESVIMAYDILKKLRRQHPDDPLVNAYYGSVTTLKGRDEAEPVKRLKGAKKGLEILDKVVAANPDLIAGHILRGNVSFRLPEAMFRRTATAIEDFKYLVERYEQDNTVFSAEFYRQILENLSRAYKTVGQADASKAVQAKLAELTGEARAESQTRTETESQIESPTETPQRPQEPPVNQVEPKPAAKIPPLNFGGDPKSAWQSFPMNFMGDPKAAFKQAPEAFQIPHAFQGPGQDLKDDTQAAEQRPQISSEERETMLREGSQLHANIRSGNKNDRAKAFNFFSQAYQANPEDKLVAAYYSDCLSMTGLDSGDMGTMFPNVFKAMKIINNAVLGEPDNIQIRFLRAYQMFRLPEAFFHRSVTAKEDFEYLIQRYEQDNSLFAPSTYLQLLYDSAIVYRRLGMEEAAKAALEKLRSLDPETYERMAQVGRILLECEFDRIHPLQEFFGAI